MPIQLGSPQCWPFLHNLFPPGGFGTELEGKASAVRTDLGETPKSAPPEPKAPRTQTSRGSESPSDNSEPESAGQARTARLERASEERQSRCPAASTGFAPRRVRSAEFVRQTRSACSAWLARGFRVHVNCWAPEQFWASLGEAALDSHALHGKWGVREREGGGPQI